METRTDYHVVIFKCEPNRVAVVGFTPVAAATRQHLETKYVSVAYRSGESNQTLISRAWARRNTGNKQKPLYRPDWSGKVNYADL